MSRRQRPKLLGVAALAGAMLVQFTNFVQAAELTLPLADLESKATTYFVSPAGQGALNGSNEGNAMPFSRLQPFIRDLKASAKIVLLPGTYNAPDAIALKAASPNDILVLEGRDNAIWHGDFNFNTLAGTDSGLRLHSGNIIVRGLNFENTGYCVKANKASAVSQVLIENIDARDIHSCILVDRDGQLPVGRWIVRDSRIHGYYRVGVRLAGAKSSEFLIDNLQINGTNTTGKSDCYKSGIQLLEGVTNITIRNVSIENNIGTCPEDDYQQGDGIEADHKGGTPANIEIENVRVSNSGDAELDLKADNVTLKNIIVNGGDFSRYAFKVWGYKNYQCTNCYAFGLHKAYVNLNRAGMTFRASTFANAKPVHVCDLRHGPTPEDQSFVKFEDSHIYIGNDEWLNECGANVLSNVTRLPMGNISPPAPVTNLQTQ